MPIPFTQRNLTLADRRRGGRNDITVAWTPLGGTTTTLTRETPLNEKNVIAMEVAGSPAGSGPAGIANVGYWGIPIFVGDSLEASLFLMSPSDGAGVGNVTVALTSPDGTAVYASTVVTSAVTDTWQKYTATLVGNANATDARLAITFTGPGSLRMDVVSLFPAENVEKGKEAGLLTPWPFRTDLLAALKALQPRFLRFPGGCYVEGDVLKARFQWKAALGGWEARAGHMNSMWGYWSTDGLGLFEYMLLAEELGAEPVWVINNGIAHVDQVPTRDIMPYVQDALDSVEFITGGAETRWGAVRAAMGRPQPWTLNYMSPGNEGCGLPWDPPNPYFKPYFLQNYLAFYGALKSKYPALRLIASCNLKDLAPTEIWEYHVYTNPGDMFGRRHVFDGMTPEGDGLVFASEYAVTDGGGHGNLIGAVAEAGFMTGMERNSKVVIGGSYAPLFVNVNAVPWPTNMILFDNYRCGALSVTILFSLTYDIRLLLLRSRWYAIPSYYVQQMFTQYLGTQRLPAALNADDPVAVSASCLNDHCTAIALKLVNMATDSTIVEVTLDGSPQLVVNEKGTLVQLTSGNPDDENSFDAPTAIAPAAAVVEGMGRNFSITVPPYSVNVLLVNLTVPSVSTF